MQDLKELLSDFDTASVDMQPLFNALGHPAVLVDRCSGRIADCNQAFERIFGYTRAEVSQFTLEKIVPGASAEAPASTYFASVRNEESIPVEVTTLRFNDGTGRDLLCTLLVPQSHAGQSVQVLHDPLTGLPTRQLFLDRFKRAVTRAKRHGTLVALLNLGLDQFHLINDTLGHDVGDRLLAMVAERLKCAVRGYDTVARFGSDEFLLLLTDVQAESGLQNALMRITKLLEEPFHLADHEVIVTATIGLSHFPVQGEDERDLLRYADLAKQHAKRQHVPFLIYSSGMAPPSPRYFKLRNRLHGAIERQELLLHYQPQVDLRDGSITGAEALIRWQSPELGFVPPLDFIPLAEETGLIGPITDWVLRAVCAQSQRWRASGLPPIRVAINLSGRSFRQPSFIESTLRTMAECGVDATHLEMEITEGTLMADTEQVNRQLSQLSEAGVFISLDDFGTGYSSLSYLKRFPLSTLKVDRSFVRDLEDDENDAMIVRGIIALAHSLKLKVVAEGVETKAQLNFLRELGCDYVQGYYFSKPLASDAFEALLQRGTPFEL